jgi:hypothetical protein
LKLRDIFSQIKGYPEKTILQQRQHSTRRFDLKRNLREHRFASQKRIPNRNSAANLAGPLMIPVRLIKERNDKTSISDRSHFLENPLRDERSAGPLIDPQCRMKGLFSFSRLARSNSSRTNRPTGTPVLCEVLLSQSASSSGSRIVIVLLTAVL